MFVHRRIRLGILGLGFAASIASAAEPIAPGVQLAELRLPDQHGQERVVGADAQLLLFSRDMKGGGVLRDWLEKDGAAVLDEHHAVYVADVSRMPGPIRAVIAKPRLRSRPYPVLLDETGTATASLPTSDGKASLIFLDHLRVTRIEQVDSVDALRAALAPAAR
jgi:hypothetical protein